ncbi:hypothetical protein SAMN05192529_109165 [Arachidicoccus rhizosphaerae]|uniref:TIGR01777 family protein n=1 Tax=Arachidicoccus rhizosphaerae TaxID=551991 RepID=A0A1H3Z1A5_9BACT|nr:TIGR01777 family oxidoreductase [Arachidicoccus rhizosphaerae]SEA17221.1 hypothetical protein SAMN05192529_109165 [Arachidicoccus rhizosphaerae]
MHTPVTDAAGNNQRHDQGLPVKKIVLAGGKGFIGSYLRIFYEKMGYQVIMLTRHPDPQQVAEAGSGYKEIAWSDEKGRLSALDGADLVVNLAGKSVNCRYTQKNKAEIFRSRLESTRLLGETILACQRPPAVWVNSSTATIYRHAEDSKMTEADGQTGMGFSVEVAKAWEQAFFSFQLPATRQAALRISIVLGPGGGALPPYINLVRYGAGGRQGSGRQRFSWIHIEDLARAVHFIEKEGLTGVFNLASPHAVVNKDFMGQLRAAVNQMEGFSLGRIMALPTPTPLLKLGAGLIGTSSELLLKSRWVFPENLLKSGFVFHYPELKGALQQILYGRQ